MNIREIRSEERQNLLDLYCHLHEDEAPSATAIAEETWKEIQANPRIKYFGAYIKDELLSTCNITIIPNLTRACRPYGVVENVVTRKDHRHAGLGTALLKHTLEYAWEQNCYKVMLMTGRMSEETFAFYEAAGFERNLKQAFVAKPEK